MKESEKKALKYGLAMVIVVLGILINHLNLGSPAFTIFGSTGNWLIYIGLVSLLIITLRTAIKPKKKKSDERMLFVANKAMRVTFIISIIAAFFIILVDGITPITVPYHLFMSYLVCGILITYYGSYKILLIKN